MYIKVRKINMIITLVVLAALIICLGSKYQECEHLRNQLVEADQQTVFHPDEPENTVITIEEPYTMITNLKSHLYMKSITVDMSKAHLWTDINGVSGFDIYDNGCVIRYIKEHVMPDQMHWYAPHSG